ALAPFADDVEALAECRAAELGHCCGALESPVRRAGQRGLEPGEGRRGEPTGVEARGALDRLEGSVRPERLLREVRRDRNAQPLRLAHVQRAERVRAAEPLLARDGVVLQLA